MPICETQDERIFQAFFVVLWCRDNYLSSTGCLQNSLFLQGPLRKGTIIYHGTQAKNTLVTGPFH